VTTYPRFLDIPEAGAAEADVILLPLPFKGTVSYGHGTAEGPRAIWEASGQIEDLDDELDFDLFSVKYHSAPEVAPNEDEEPESYLARVAEAARALHRDYPAGLIFGIGGEHSVTPALVRALDVKGVDFSKLTVVQIDAHADLRDQYEETPHSHACAMRRLVELGASIIAIGIRSADREEAQFGRECGCVRTFGAQALANDPSRERELLETLGRLSGDVYLTVDIDGFETYLCPGTGTPQPGGLTWWQGLRYLRRLVLENKAARLVGCDITEVAPQPGTSVNEFIAAKLALKIIAYHQCRG
jgi:agmatinase